MTCRSRRLAGLALVALAMAACNALNPAERATIAAWLGCIECNANELGDVLDLAGLRREPVVDALRAGLLEGPNSVQRQAMGRQLDSLHGTLAAFRVGVGAGPQADFRRRYLDNLIATYRVRSAIALARIGGVDVKPALDSGAANQLRTPGDTLRPADLDAVAFARDSIWHP